MSARVRFGPDEPLTDRLFRRLCRYNPDLRLERTAAGELIVMSPAGSDSARRNFLLAARLGAWSELNGQGVAFDSSAGFTLPNGAIRAPDACWVTQERWDGLTRQEQRGFAPFCPDFVVELRSTTDALRDVQDKMREYRAQGARLGWLIDPVRQTVTIYRPGRRVEVLKAPATLSGEEVLPGFTLNLKGILTD
jgi:Uma2 family endonuclease